MERRRLAKKFFLLAGVVSVLVLCVYLAWFYHAQSIENDRRALAEARVLSAEIGAAWDYIDAVQPQINRATGETSGIYCAVAAKDIAKRFSAGSAYSIRYIRGNPRNTEDAPDDFERKALSSFEEGVVEEYYGLEHQGDSSVFRYVGLLEIEDGCLPCHGDPAGEKDITGYAKEGMAEGDVAGAVSIVMPMDSIIADAKADLVSTVVFFGVLMGSVTLVLALGLRTWITAPIVDENKKLRHEAEDQSNFLTIITHELKTPLSSILAFTELWKERMPDDSPESRALVNEVETNARVLLAMINNVLDAAKLEAGTLSLAQDEFDVYDLAGQVKATMGPLAKKKDVSFKVKVSPDTPLLLGDEEVLRRIVVNLVNNALRFTDSGGWVELQLAYREGRFVICVCDNGCGIPAEQLDHVFDRFVSAPHSETTSEGGTGLGLSIVRNFSTMMGGNASVKSLEGEGSCFTVELPLPAIPDEVEEGDDAADTGLPLADEPSADSLCSREGGNHEPS